MFAVTLNRGSTSNVTVQYATSNGTATTSASAVGGADYTAATGTLTIDAGDTEGTITVATGDDTTDEENETFTVTLSNQSANATLDTGLATGTITDNDSAPNVTIAVGTAVEGSGVSFTVTLGAVTAKQVTVVYGTSDGTATDSAGEVGGIDYTTTSGTLTITAGQTEGTVTVATGDDSTDEDNENFTVTLSNSVNATITGGSATGTITDNDDPPGVTVTGDTAAEGSSLSFVVDLDAATAKQVTLQYSTSDGTATTSTSAPGGADYTGASSQTLNITPGQTTATITINTANDTTDEPDEETFTVTLDSATNATLGSPNSVTGTITDNDDPPTPTLALALSIGENGGSTTVTASLNHPSSQATTVTVTSAAVAPAVAADFTQSGTTLTIAAGLLTSTGTVTLAAVNNDVDAAPKEVTVSGTASNGLGIGGDPASLTLTIDDDEPTPSVTLVLATNPICESGTNAGGECDAAVPASTAVTATLSGKSSHVTTVTVASVAVGPAVAGDFTQSGTTLTIAVEALTSTGVVTLGAVENNTDAPDKQVTVSALVDNTQGATAPSNVTLTIEDDEPAPTVTLTLGQNPICESGTNAGGNQCTSTVASTVLTPSLSHPSSEPTTVTVLSSPHYERSVSALTIAAGATTVSGVTLTAVDNGTDAPNNDVTVSATASNTQGYAGDPASLTLTIEDDEPVPTVTLTLGQNPICESNANAGGQCTATVASTAVTASQSHPSSEATTVTVSAVAVAPAVAGDFSLSGNVELVIAAGSTDSTGVVTVTAVDNDTDAPPKDVTVSGAAVNPHDIAGDPASLTLTIEDDEPAPTVTLALSSTLVAEAGGVTTVTASQSHPSSEATTVTVSAEAVAAPAVAADFTQSGTTLTIPAGSTDSTGTVAVTGVNNDVDHDPATKEVEVSGTAANPYAVAGDPPALRFELQDDDTRGFAWTPEVLVARENTAAILAVALTSEPTSNVTLRFEHDKGSVLVYFLLNGEFSPVLTFTPGNWDVPQELALLHTDPPDTVDFRHVTSGGDYEGYTDTFTFTVTDSATPSTAVNLNVNPPTVAEGGGEQQVTVTATLEGAALLTATEVAVTVSGDTATEGDDFGAVAAVTVTIAAEAQQGTGTLTVTPVADEVAEGDERLTVAGTSTGTLTVNAAVLILVDDDERGVTVSEAGLTVAEGGEAAYTVVLTSEPTGPVEVAVSAAGADAGDLTIAPAVLTFTPANWETARTVTVSAAADADAEDDAAVITHAVSGADYGENGETAQDVAVTVTDGDTRSTTVALRVAPGAVAEDGGTVTVTVTATVNAAPPKSDLPVRMQVGTATATEGADFATVADFTLTIAAGTTQGSGTFGLRPVDDVLAEGNESVEVGGNVAGLAVNGTTVTITDDDAVSTAVALTVEPLSVREDAGTAEVTVTAALDAGARTSDTEVTVAVISGTATAGTDFAEVAEFGLTIATGETEGTGTFTLTLMDDALSEGPETVRLVAQAPAGLTVTEAAVEITDDDVVSTGLTLSAEPAAVDEGAGATDVAVTATLDGAARDSVTIVTVTVAPGTAEAGTDYVSVGSFEVMIPVGEVSGTGTFTLTPTDDTLSEGPETVALTGSAPDGLTVTDTTLEITDDDAASTGVTLTAAPVSVAEDAGPTAVTVTAALDGGALNENVVVTVTVGSGTAEAERDFGGVADFEITIAAGATEGAVVFTLVPVDDVVSEGPETVVVQGSAGGGLVVSGTEVEIADNDAASTGVTLVAAPGTLREDAGPTAVTVTGMLDAGARAEDTVVTVMAGSGTAEAGTDFEAVADFALTIAAGATEGSGTFTLTPTDDTLSEGPETVALTGSAPDGLTVTETTLEITDNDAASTAVTLTAAPVSVDEGAETVQVTVTAALNGAPHTDDTVVMVTVGSGTAQAGSDFSAAAGLEITISAGAAEGAGTFTLTLLDDTLSEQAETVSLAGTASTGLPVNGTTVEITDNDAAPTRVLLTAAPASVDEGAGSVQVTVTAALNGAALADDTVVTVTVASGTADTSADFTAVAEFEITISAGAASGSGIFTLSPVDDTVDEDTETLTLAGTATNGLVVSATTVEIADNDEPAATAVTLTALPASVNEDAGSVQVTVTATLNGPARDNDATVTVSVSAGTATTTDFAAVTDFDITITAGDTSGTGTFSLAPVDDSLDENTETVAVTGTTTSGLTVNPTTVEIADNDDVPAATAVTLTALPASVNEDAGSAQVTVTATLNGPRPRQRMATVTVSVSAEHQQPRLTSPRP